MKRKILLIGGTGTISSAMERYFTKDDDMDLTTDLTEAVLRRMKTAIFDVLKAEDMEAIYRMARG